MLGCSDIKDYYVQRLVFNYLHTNLTGHRLTKVVEGDVELLYVDEHGPFGNSDHLFIT